MALEPESNDGTAKPALSSAGFDGVELGPGQGKAILPYVTLACGHLRWSLERRAERRTDGGAYASFIVIEDGSELVVREQHYALLIQGQKRVVQKDIQCQKLTCVIGSSFGRCGDLRVALEPLSRSLGAHFPGHHCWGPSHTLSFLTILPRRPLPALLSFCLSSTSAPVPVCPCPARIGVVFRPDRWLDDWLAGWPSVKSNSTSSCFQPRTTTCAAAHAL